MQKTKKQILLTLRGEHEFYSSDLDASITFSYTPQFDATSDCPGNEAIIETLSIDNAQYDYTELDYLLACAEHIKYLVENYEADEADYLSDLRRDK